MSPPRKRKQKIVKAELEPTSDANADGEPWPKFMGEASTKSWLLRAAKKDRDSIAWQYYQKPVRSYLARLGCPKQDQDDLTNDILLKLYNYILIHYDPKRRFRPYFKTSIKHAYFNYFNKKAKAGTETDEHLESDDERDDEESDIFVEGLKDYARHIYEFYSRDIPRDLKKGAQMLHNWIIDGVSQDALSVQWRMTDRYIRTHINEAADHFSNWLHKRVNPDDISELTSLAAKYGCAVDEGVWNFRNLFRHASRRKRMNTLLILSFVYRKFEKDQTPSG